jgi:regulator of protease activity HflC (stomatin/prohibitin superfamily)
MSFKFKFFGSIVAFIVIVALIFVLFFITKFSTQPDQAGLHYKAGPFSSTQFANCVDPGTRVWDGPADKHYAYPAGQRTYDFSGTSPEPDAAPFAVASVDNQELTVSGVATFQFATDCDTLKKFHETIGNKFKAYMDGDTTSDGWRSMLSVYMNQSLQRAMNEAAQGLTWKALYNDPATKAKWEKDVAVLLPKIIEQQTGGEKYFTNFTLTLQKPQPPENLLKALQDREVAVEQNLAQEQRNTTVTTEIQSIRELVAVLGPDGYNVYQAIKDNKIKVMPIPQGSSVVVNGG